MVKITTNENGAHQYVAEPPAEDAPRFAPDEFQGRVQIVIIDGAAPAYVPALPALQE